MRSTNLAIAIAVAAFAVGCRQKADPTGGVVITPGSEQEKIQGVWGVEAIDSGNPKKGMRESDKDVRLQFKGDRLMFIERGRAGEISSFVLDSSKDPKTMTLTELDFEGEPVRVRMTGMTAARSGAMKKRVWLYKFEGDVLVLAVSKDDEPPTEFKARPWNQKEPQKGEITIVRLKKTDESFADPPKRGPSTAPYRGTAAYRPTKR